MNLILIPCKAINIYELSRKQSKFLQQNLFSVIVMANFKHHFKANLSEALQSDVPEQVANSVVCLQKRKRDRESKAPVKDQQAGP